MEKIKIGKSFKFISSSLDKIINKNLRDRGLSATQGIVLVWLNDEKTNELPIKTIEKRFGTAQSTTLGVINRLEQKGLITTHLSEQRSKIAKITPAGRELIDFVIEQIKAAEDMMVEDFTQGEKALFFELIRKAEHKLLQQQGVDMKEYYER